MTDGISSALSGLSAANHRLEVSANNLANVMSNGSVPASDAAEQRGAYQPLRVEQSSTAQGGTQTSDRLVRPSYIPAFDTGSSLADSNGQVAAPNVDIAAEFTEQTGARQSFEANLKVVKSMSELVKKLYDLPP